MLFNSFNFAIFLPITFLIYWRIPNANYKKQNILLFVASYFFYANWDKRFLFLLLFSTLLDYATGIKIKSANSKQLKRLWLYLSLILNFAFLILFKYYNFFILSFTEVISSFGLVINPVLLNIVLPLGISFYTFHGISYVLDIYNEKIDPEKNFVDYALFVSFFPLLVAGPIERATHLLPQLKKKENLITINQLTA
jgi:alginate O-acetyltransferase complex protein AlgI